MLQEEQAPRRLPQVDAPAEGLLGQNEVVSRRVVAAQR